MSKGDNITDQEIMLYVAMALVTLWVVFSLGALVIVIAAITITVFKAFKASFIISVGAAFAAFIIGALISHDLIFWLMQPVYIMQSFYIQTLPDSIITLFITPDELGIFMNLLVIQSWLSLTDAYLWGAFAPVGIFCG